MKFPGTRLRRLRSGKVRELVRECRFGIDDLICPVFVDERIKKPQAIISMPGQFRIPLSGVADEASEIADLGIPALILFGLPEEKDESGS
ncbi:MAG TPA: porphobilinogen synthase, partial [Candidatus Methanoperedenaceae archaeon]|nr:porphobilinogen synthase [Candidatus Methanoperedenaceae archaeon]